jgi:hypothetical protein
MINIDKKWKRELLDDLTKSLIEHRITAFRFTQCESLLYISKTQKEYRDGIADLGTPNHCPV